ncbi:unnamed protein product [Mortierella alpina]
MREMSQKIKETEATSMQNGRKRQRDLLQFRQALTTLTMQVDELERIKLGYYFGTLESEQSNLQLILQKTSTVVRAEVDIYERIAQKGLNDLILEPMTTQGPDPYCTYPTTDEFSSIFSILPPTPIIPTSGSAPGATGTSTPQPEAIMSNFYGYHEANPFSTARNQTNATPRDRHLFGEASSAESKESLMTKAAVLTAAVAVAANAAQAATSEADKRAKASTAAATTLEQSTLHQSSSSNPSSSDVQEEHSDEGKESNTRSPTPELGVKSLAVAGISGKELKGGSDGFQKSTSNTEKVNPDKDASTSDPSTEALGMNAALPDASDSDNQRPSSSSHGVDMPRGEQHHRSQVTSKPTEDGSHPTSSVGEQASSERSFSAQAPSIRSLSGSRSLRMFSSTPDSPPVRGMIHIGQDSELLNNRDFSFSYEPTELLEQRSHHHHHSQLNLNRHSSGLQEFGGFAAMEEEEGGFGATPPTTHHQHQEQHQEQQQQQQQQQSRVQHKSSSSSEMGHDLRHRSSDGQLSHSSSSNLSSLASSGSAGSLHHRRSLGRIRTDQDGSSSSHGAAVFGTSLESEKQQQVEVADHIRELGRGFDDGMPAFFADDDEEVDEEKEKESEAVMVQPRYSHHGIYGSGHVSRRESNQSVASMIRMADGSSKNVSTTHLNEIAA